MRQRRYFTFLKRVCFTSGSLEKVSAFSSTKTSSSAVGLTGLPGVEVPDADFPGLLTGCTLNRSELSAISKSISLYQTAKDEQIRLQISKNEKGLIFR